MSSSGLVAYHAVIMAGGGGTRLWPLSRQDRPKQALRLLGERTMFQIAVERLAPLFTPDRIWVVTSARYTQELRLQCPELPDENFILEPAPRGTAPAIGLAAFRVQERDPNAIMACLTADHHIGQETRFRDLLAAAAAVAAKGSLVTLGIQPTHPATGFGYIQRGEQLDDAGGFEVYKAKRFKEKPVLEEAQAMVADGEHAWNSGMFVWRVVRFLDEVRRQLPPLHRALSEAASGRQDLQTAWAAVPDITLDYGIMERARDVAVIPADGLEWNDIGSWEALLEVLPADTDGNVVVGAEHLGLDTKGTLVHASSRGPAPKLVATIGLENLVIVDTDDVLLVCTRERSQEIRTLVNRLKQGSSKDERL